MLLLTYRPWPGPGDAATSVRRRRSPAGAFLLLQWLRRTCSTRFTSGTPPATLRPCRDVSAKLQSVKHRCHCGRD